MAARRIVANVFHLLLLAVALAMPARAQVVETPIPFDSAGRVMIITPAIAARLGIAPPAFQVTGTFATARLYVSNAGETVLVVERPTGVIERYALSSTALADLRAVVSTGLGVARGIPAETDLPSQPAARQFTRNQMLLGLLLYGPNLALLANDAKTGTVLYLLGASGTYFGVAALTRNNTITRAQNRLATDGAIRGYIAANALLTTIAGDVPDGKTVAGAGLVGAVGGTLGGLAYGRGLSDAEAKSATTTSSFAALTAGGLLGTLGVSDSRAERTVSGVMLAAGALGYAMGPRYPRLASYRVTVGDVNMLWIGAALGTATVMIPIVDSHDIDPQAGFAIATAGMLGGIFAADRGWVRKYDHSGSDVTMMWLGTAAGALVGGAAIVLAEPSDASVGLALVTAGGALGAFTTHRMLGVAPDASSALRVGNADIEFSAAGLAFAASRTPGSHPLIRLRF